MSNVYELPRRTDPLDQASDWLAKLERGLRNDEEQHLREWTRNTQNMTALLEVAKIWDKMDALQCLADLYPEPPVPKRARLPGYALVATCLLLMSATLSLWVVTNHSRGHLQSKQIVQTTIGEKNTVDLPDGSQLTLNTDSKVRLHFSNRERRLILVQGEAFINIARDRSRPLRFQVHDRVVEAVGTAFNLKMTHNHNIELIVTEGNVLVTTVDAQASASLSAAKPSAPFQESALPLSSGESLLLVGEEQSPEQLAPEEIAVRLAWQGGNLVFRGETLMEALTEIERYTTTEFLIADDSLKSAQVVGIFKAGDIAGLLESLGKNFNIVHEHIATNTVVLREAKTPKDKHDS